MIDDNHEKFYTKIISTAEGVLRVTIPQNLAEGAGFKAGDKVKIWIKKIEGVDNDDIQDSQ